MKRTTKSSNYLGKEYFENAAKQIPWPVEVGQKKDDYKGVIHVPFNELEQANEHLMVTHLLNHGFVIQQTITEISRTEVFDPVIRLKDHKPFKEIPDDNFGIGKMFKVSSVGTRLIITKSSAESVELKYMDGEKLPIRTTRPLIERSLNLGAWQRI